MGQAWDKEKNEASDNTENQKQNQNNNGNIGREEAADITQRHQNPNEIGQFGTTAEQGSGSINSGHWDSKKDSEYNAQRNTPPGNYTGNAEDNWKQGTEGSPGEGYSEAGTPASKQPASPGGVTGETNKLNPLKAQQNPPGYDEYDEDDDPRNELL